MSKKNKKNKKNKKVNIYEEELQEIVDSIHKDEEKKNKITPEQQDIIDSIDSMESLGENLGKKPEERTDTDVEDKSDPELEKSFEEIANEIKAKKKAKKSEAAKNIKKDANLSSSEEDEDDAAKKIKEEKKAKKAQKQQNDIDFILDESDFSDTKLGGKQDTDNEDKKKSDKKKYNDLVASSLMGTAYDLKPQNNDDTIDITEYAIKQLRSVETKDNKTLSLLIDSLEESLMDGFDIDLDNKKIKDIIDAIVKDPSNTDSIMEVAKMFHFEDFQSKLMEAKLDLETVNKVSRLAKFAAMLDELGAIPGEIKSYICSSLQYTVYKKAKELKDDELLIKMDEHIPFLNPQTIISTVKEFSKSDEIKTFIKDFEWMTEDAIVYDTIDRTFYRYNKMFSMNHDEFAKLLMNYSNDMDFLLDRESLNYFIDREYSDIEKEFIGYMKDMEEI